MTKVDDGGPVFPHVNDEVQGVEPGISRRDCLAGQNFAAWFGQNVGERTKADSLRYIQDAARLSYVGADAVIAAGKEESGERV